jgi:hypothetical protein
MAVLPSLLIATALPTKSVATPSGEVSFACKLKGLASRAAGTSFAPVAFTHIQLPAMPNHINNDIVRFISMPPVGDPKIMDRDCRHRFRLTSSSNARTFVRSSNYMIFCPAKKSL